MIKLKKTIYNREIVISSINEFNQINNQNMVNYSETDDYIIIESDQKRIQNEICNYILKKQINEDDS